MKFRNLFWGALLVTIGLLFVLRNLDIIDFSWYSFLELWPMILILWGVSILPLKDLFKVVLAFLVIGSSVFYVTYNNDYHHWGFSVNHSDIVIDREDDEDFDEEFHNWSDQHLKESYNVEVQKVMLDFDAAAGKFYLADTTFDMIDFQSRGNVGNYYMTSRDDDSLRYIKISHEEDMHINGPYKNQAVVRLNPNPVWDIDLDVGAASMDLDLSPFKVKKLDIDGGASSLKIKLGDRCLDSDISIEAGMASIVIRVPETAGCELKTSNFLSSRNIKGFERIDESTFRTPDFDDSEQKIKVRIETAFSSFTVKRY